MRGFVERTLNYVIPIEAGMPVYYLDPTVDEMRLGRVVRVVGTNAIVVRNGKREQVPLSCMAVAKKAYKEEMHGNAS